MPDGLAKPKFLQLYFFDGQHVKENRCGIFPEINSSIVGLLMEIMQRNPYAHFFGLLRHLDVTEDTKVLLSKNPTLDQRVYNSPTLNEVTAIWIDDLPSNETRSLYIVVWGKSSMSHCIYHYYGCYNPLQYPLLFPFGDCGWHQGLRKVPDGQRSARVNDRNPITSYIVQIVEELLLDEASGKCL